MVRTRLRARLQGWQLYRIGADLATLPGKTCDATLELLAQRLVTSALSNSFLPSGSFRVQTTRSGGKLDIYVYLSNSLLAQAALDTTSGASHLPGRETQLVQKCPSGIHTRCLSPWEKQKSPRARSSPLSSPLRPARGCRPLMCAAVRGRLGHQRSATAPVCGAGRRVVTVGCPRLTQCWRVGLGKALSLLPLSPVRGGCSGLSWRLDLAGEGYI